MLEFEETDELFVGDDILKEFGSCTDCGLCCNFFSTLPLYDNELMHISKQLSIQLEEFKQNYTKRITSPEKLVSYSLQIPCPFLKQKKCTIYKNRFLVCRTFPLFLNITKNKAVLTGIYLCPQATQFYEGLLAFYKEHHHELYDQIITIEKQVALDEQGMKIQGGLTLFSHYLDWLYNRTSIQRTGEDKNNG